MEPIVETLRNVEESLIASDHEPADIDTATDGVPDDVTQHLRHTAADARRADVPNVGTIENTPGLIRNADELVDTVRSDKTRKTMERMGRHSDLGEAPPCLHNAPWRPQHTNFNVQGFFIAPGIRRRLPGILYSGSVSPHPRAWPSEFSCSIAFRLVFAI